MNGYYIVADNPTIKIQIEPQDMIFLSNKGIIELVLPMCKSIYCVRNFLTKLTIPKGVKLVSCSNNYLNELYIPRSCKEVYYYNNLLPQVIVDLLESEDTIKMQLANNLQLANCIQVANNLQLNTINQYE
jgi:hypothetical protein